jgi:SAM-dependent methyltransferase/uncharacterized protein YbaR (Trm112 family)
VRREHFQAIAPVCPVCRVVEQGTLDGVAHPLVIQHIYEEQGPHIVQGVLQCTNSRCLFEYPVIDGIPMIVPSIRQYVQNNLLGITMRPDLSPAIESMIGDCAGASGTFDIHRQHLSHYASDHWADLDQALSERDRHEAGGVLRLLDTGMGLLDAVPGGPVLDMGCSVGRTSFELAARTDGLVLGIDLNFSMLRVASEVLRNQRVSYARRRVGLVYDRRDYEVHMEGADRVDFWQCDVLALPFSPHSFGLVTSVNLLDCLSAPMNHLHSLAELMSTAGRTILATPFDWSPNATPMEYWIGGHSQRADHRGASDVCLRKWLPSVSLAALAEVPEVEWSVRLHERSSVRYRSHMMILGPA